jgi:hypothetical protein
MRSAREIAQGETMRNGVWMISRLPLAAALLALPAYAADVNTWRYTSGSNMVNGEYAPGAFGFNLADVSSLANLNRLPDGVKGLVYIGTSAGGCTGNSAQFRRSWSLQG